MTPPLAFVDLETINLVGGDPALPRWESIWEYGAVVVRDGHLHEYTYMVEVDCSCADTFSLEVGGYHTRHPQGNAYVQTGKRPVPTSHVALAGHVAKQLHGCHLLGAVVSFDEKRLELLLRAHKLCPSWHYHLGDVENLAAGYLAARDRFSPHGPLLVDGEPLVKPGPPWDSEALSAALGVDPSRFDRHTALGDCWWSFALYEAAMGPLDLTDDTRASLEGKGAPL